MREKNITMNNKKGLYQRFFKRVLDLILALIALIVLSPVLLGVSILIKLKLGSPVLFKQDRPGYKGNIFTMYKFRTMTADVDNDGQLLPDANRLTNLGKFLRSTSIDELPELLNIIKGDMSIIGPRPLLVQYLSLYNTYQFRRHDVKPGLSGKAQVNGRNCISWNEKFDLDIEYIDNISFLGDVIIILKTIRKVFEREGVNSDITTTMEPFKGSEEREK